MKGIYSGNHSKIDTTIEGVDSPAGLLGSKRETKMIEIEKEILVHRGLREIRVTKEILEHRGHLVVMGMGLRALREIKEIPEHRVHRGHLVVVVL